MKTHPLNVSYLVLGLVFLGVSGSWALRASNLVDASQLRWLLPLTLVVAGVVGLVAFGARGLGGDDEEPRETAGAPYDSRYDDDPYHRRGDL